MPVHEKIKLAQGNAEKLVVLLAGDFMVGAKAADIRIADIVSENDEDVGLFLVGHDHDLSK